MPNATAHDDPTTPASPRHDFDALADLFLGPDEAPLHHADQPIPFRDHRRTMAEIELVVLGHLPVRAGPWVLQYARARAADLRAPVALVRLTDGLLRVEGVGDEAWTEQADLVEALTAARARAAAILLQVDETSLPALSADSLATAITLLSGDNDAAVVAAYRTIKSIAPRLPAGADLRIAFISRDRVEADESLARLRDAVALFLDRPLHRAVVIERIAPTRTFTLYQGEFIGGMPRVLAILASPIESAGQSDPAPVDRRADADGPASLPPILASLITGLRPLTLHWPDDPTVELALDADGAWHVLRADADGRGVERLIAASAWLTKHRALLHATGVGHAPHSGSMPRPSDTPACPAGQAVVMHLFTSTPRSVRHLLDTDLRIHLLTPVADRWCCVELN